MQHSSPPGRAGRPKDPAKHAAIVAIATRLFAELPYETVTMEAVAAQAGVSKMTVYSHFSDKEALFETIVAAVSESMMREAVAPDRRDQSLQQRLEAFGIGFLTVILRPHVVAMVHSLPGALRGNPALAQRFYDAGPGRIRDALAAIIADAAASGELVVDVPALAADDLVNLWEGCLPAQVAFGIADLATPEEIIRRARRGTAVFLRAYAVQATGRIRPAE
jgi:TetR/AcrR family transcriptional repressor of mexJK operon